MANKGPWTEEEMKAQQLKEDQRFDRIMGRFNYVSASGAAVALAAAAAVAIAAPVAVPVALGAAAGLGALWVGGRVVDHIHHDHRPNGGPGF